MIEENFCQEKKKKNHTSPRETPTPPYIPMRDFHVQYVKTCIHLVYCFRLCTVAQGFNK